MKKICILTFLSALILTLCASGCSSPRSAKKVSVAEIDVSAISSDDIREASYGGGGVANGEFFSLDGGALGFFDFGSMQETVVCSDPNCRHDSSKECSSYGMLDHPTLYNGHLYFFDHRLERDKDNRLMDVTDIIRADTDGTVRQTVATFEGYDISPLKAVMVGDVLFFTLENREYGEYEQSNFSKHYLYAFDMKNNAVCEIAKLCEGYNAEVVLCGYFDDKIYILTLHYETDISFSTIEEHAAFAKDHMIISNKYYDIASGTVEESPLPEPIYVDKSAYIFRDNEGVAVINAKMEQHTIQTEENLGEPSIADNKIFFFYVDMCYDLETNRLYKLNRSAIGSEHKIDIYYVLRKLNDKYIVKAGHTSEQGYLSVEYFAVTPSELIGEETNEYTIA